MRLSICMRCAKPETDKRTCARDQNPPKKWWEDRKGEGKFYPGALSCLSLLCAVSASLLILRMWDPGPPDPPDTIRAIILGGTKQQGHGVGDEEKEIQKQQVRMGRKYNRAVRAFRY